jgi:hypothetical protein
MEISQRIQAMIGIHRMNSKWKEMKGRGWAEIVELKSTGRKDRYHAECLAFVSRRNFARALSRSSQSNRKRIKSHPWSLVYWGKMSCVLEAPEYWPDYVNLGNL